MSLSNISAVIAIESNRWGVPTSVLHPKPASVHAKGIRSIRRAISAPPNAVTLLDLGASCQIYMTACWHFPIVRNKKKFRCWSCDEAELVGHKRDLHFSPVPLSACSLALRSNQGNQAPLTETDCPLSYFRRCIHRTRRCWWFYKRARSCQLPFRKKIRTAKVRTAKYKILPRWCVLWVVPHWPLR